MPVFSGTPVPITRMLGQVDQDDPTNLPMGCASVCRNTDFTRDAVGGVTAANTRAGNCMIMQGAPSPGTGFWDFQYEPISLDDPFFQMPLRFTLSGMLERESPVGTGRMIPIPGGQMYSLPTQSHKVDAQAGNIVWSAYSDLKKPTSGLSGFNPKTLLLDPLGMKPFGWRWLPSTSVVYANEVATPSNQSAGPQGNGHTYQAQNNGATGPVEPVWPLTEGGTVTEVLTVAQLAAGLVPVTWKELTMVIANRIPVPPPPVFTLIGGGSFAAGLDIYIRVSLRNAQGETTLSDATKVGPTTGGNAVHLTVPGLNTMAGWIQNLPSQYIPEFYVIYAATVATGNPEPPVSAYGPLDLLGLSVPTYFEDIPGPIGVGALPQTNTARITPGQLPVPTQGPALTRSPGIGTYPAGRDIYVRLSYANNNGETPLGPAQTIINTLLNDAVIVDLTDLADAKEFPQLNTVNVYAADVPTGTAAPPVEDFSLALQSAPGATFNIITPPAGRPPVTVNGTGPAGNITGDTVDGGINGTQGYRYAVPCWINRNETFSGFEQAAVSKYIVDEDGWEISVFNVAIGPANIVGRAVNWSVADSTQAGPFWWIGLVNLQVPSQNVVYPNSFQSDGITIVPTVFLDNVTTSGTFNFTDDYLKSANDTTDRLRVKAPPQGVRVDFLTTANRLAISGVPGLAGPVVSLGEDYESFYGDTSPVPIPTAKGENCWGCVEFRNQIYVLRSQSGLVMVPGSGDPASWDVNGRWGPTADSEGVGPCGPRAFAACSTFIVFVHRTGLYKYDGTGNPDLMTKEIPRMWSWINWAAAETIDVMIDNDTHTVRIQVPVGRSNTPNMEYCLSYLEGWQNPIHFFGYQQRESTLEAARRWSFNDVSAYICRRIQRQVANPPPIQLAPDGTTQTTSDFYTSQLAYTQTDPSGVVNARTPGRYDDNGAGIDWKYQGVSAQAMQKPCKPEGVVTSAVGYGSINVGFLAARKKITDQNGAANVLWCSQMDLDPQGSVDYTRKPKRRLDEYWSVLYTNGKVPGVWASIKKAIVYVIPVKAARGTLDRGQ